ncbi:hypothetical protein T459_25810 [Capsicum annuum]|uniref:Glutamyl-tRNA reductase N-terminal domain-containing protein n=1 Tax=Capsicum annuum TaxID=4072 RepID=A0A2G2YLT8_CAPAN|nr:hypothetical protein T459_25810 [Capsicum annuum]
MQSRCHTTSSCWTGFPGPGEGQILTQVKQVVENGQGVPGFGRKIGDLFKHAITAGKRVRTDTNISNGSVSVSSAVVELIGTSKLDMITMSFGLSPVSNYDSLGVLILIMVVLGVVVSLSFGSSPTSD